MFTLGWKSCKENKLREFNFKFIQRIIVTRKELFRFKIKDGGNCIYCGEADFIDQSFINCRFTRRSTRRCYSGLTQHTILPSG